MSDEPLLHVVRDVDGLPGQWRYTVPQTGITLSDSWWSGLRDKVYAHLRANGIEVDDELALVIEDAVCRETRPGSKCAPRKAKPIGGMPLPLLSHVNRFLQAILQTLKDRDFVPRAESERRLAICQECPLRSDLPGGCQGCFSLITAVTKRFSNDPLKIEPDADGVVRDACSACWCHLPSKVRVSRATLDKIDGAIRPPYARGCWMLEERG